MRKLWIVTSQTYLRQVKSWSFIIFVLSPFLLFGISGGVGYFSAKSAETSVSDKIAVVSAQKTVRQQYLKQNKDDVAAKYKTQAAAKKALHDSEIAGYLVLDTDQHQVKATYHSTDAMDSELRTKTMVFINSMQQQVNYANAKLSPQQAQTLTIQPQFDQQLKETSNETQKIAAQISFWIIVLMVYMVLINYASIVANEIASEKGTKIMEIIFSSTAPAKYFYGKLLGVFLVILTQLCLYLVGGWAIFQGAKQLQLVQDFLDSGGELIKLIIQNLLNANLLFLLLGVMIYTILAAFSGALVSKVEDASKAATPVIYLSMVAFFITIPFQDNASALLVKILSYVPFFSSFFMPMRIIDHSASGLEITLSLVILAAAVVLLAVYIGRIYGGLMLQTDDTSFWKRFKKGLAYSK
ncbi:ABC transporter permease protein [Ligilactobacillus salitolerans]|uniref:ABC transporter permease protein n=1 Tax=Ligilactobacillus salitolerans TaxID=1808352 RepID=A0A401IPV7_9LACO|nr:ABC transporter permease [Ligilactobacillus salitolerans]GBG93571.1 ABC transporter permease protein [Ligilactobacillus salitolerans]